MSKLRSRLRTSLFEMNASSPPLSMQYAIGSDTSESRKEPSAWLVPIILAWFARAIWRAFSTHSSNCA
ncbi:hypothetical protein L5D93_21745 [Paenibacillus thiaminolyticus]|nr:hypothetical protein [Paenibacillus thiaminolyticus]